MSGERRLQPEIVIEAEGWPDVSAVVSICFEAVMTYEPEGFLPGQVAVLLTDDAAMRGLNTQFRDKDAPTNVLSFPAGDPPPGLPPQAPVPVGDIALGLETCAREAAAKGISLEDHTAHLVIHGLLHLFGYDHISSEDAALMEGLEITLLAQMDIKNPYEV